MTQPAKHTPGPWVAEGDDNGYMIVGPRQCYVADICSADGLANDNNANLIAAAPAMYEALRQALTTIEQTLSITERNKIRDNVLGALAQADGKQ